MGSNQTNLDEYFRKEMNIVREQAKLMSQANGN